jgi:hypothetical protein
MKCANIILRTESLEILRNDLHEAALEEHAAELAMATAVERQKMMAQIDRGNERDLRFLTSWVEPGRLIY